MATFKKLAPVLFCNEIAPCLPFWERLGFVRAIEVPGFVILAKDGIEVMYQTRASAGADAPAALEGAGRAFVYLDVDDLDDVISRLGDAPVVVARRTAPYGADEIFVREPAGHVIGFARPAPA